MTWAVEQRTGSAARKAVLMNLADRADEAWSCFPSQARIARETELGVRTVRRSLDDLEGMGLIRRERRRRKDGTWTSDRFVLSGVESDQRPEAPAATEAIGHGGRIGDTPAATQAADPAATQAGHEPSLSSLTVTEVAPNAGAGTLRSVPSKASARKPRKTAIPKDFTITPRLREWHRSKGISDVDADRETEKFINGAHTHARRYVDWDSAWRNWILQAVDYGHITPGKSDAMPHYWRQAMS